MFHKTNKAEDWVRVWNVQTRKGRGSLDALWGKKKKKVSPRFKRKTAPNSFWPQKAKNIRKNNKAQRLQTRGF